MAGMLPSAACDLGHSRVTVCKGATCPANCRPCFCFSQRLGSGGGVTAAVPSLWDGGAVASQI